MKINTATITHLFFDVDGVLINGFHHAEEHRNLWTKNITADLGIIEGELEQELFRGGPWSDVIRGNVDLSHALAEVLPRIGYTGEIDSFINYWLEKDSDINQNVLEFVSMLKQSCPHLSFSITTNQEHKRANYLWDVCGFSRSFDHLFYSAMVGATKEEPDFFKRVIDATSLISARQGLVIDDSPAVLNEAERQGFQVFQFTECERSLSELRSIWGVSRDPRTR